MTLTYYLVGVCTILHSIYAAFMLNFINPSGEMLQSLLISNLLLVITIVLYCIKTSIKSTFTLFAYTLAFTVFNFGYYIANIFNPKFNEIVYGYTTFISYQSVAISFSITFLALVSFFLSYITFQKYFKVKRKSSEAANLFYNTNQELIKTKFITKYTMYLCAIFAFTKLTLAIVQVQRLGYSSLYTNVNGYSIPLIDLFDSFFIIGFFSYLGTLPSYKKMRIPLLLFFIYSFMSILSGKRGFLITGLLTLVWYFVKRDDLKIDAKKVFTKSRSVIVIIIGMILTYGMFIFSQVRHTFGQENGDQGNRTGFFEGIINMVDQLGFSGRLISVAIENESKFPYTDSYLYVFYPILNYLQNNVISRLLGFGYENFTSVEYLERSHNFGGWLAYIFRPESFLRGGGVGTNYLAEGYMAFGLTGVIIINLILGILLAYGDNLTFKNWKLNTLLISVFSIIIFMPRSSTLGIIPASISLVAYLLILSVLIKKKKNKVMVT